MNTTRPVKAPRGCCADGAMTPKAALTGGPSNTASGAATLGSHQSGDQISFRFGSSGPSMSSSMYGPTLSGGTGLTACATLCTQTIEKNRREVKRQVRIRFIYTLLQRE